MYVEVTGPNETPPREHPRAIVTIALGAQYLARWRALVEASFRAYAARHGYDAILVAGHLDRSWRALKRSAAWQKCLILSQPWSQGYERIVWIDADCVPKTGAPDISDDVPIECVGANTVFEQLSAKPVHNVVVCPQYPEAFISFASPRRVLPGTTLSVEVARDRLTGKILEIRPAA